MPSNVLLCIFIYSNVANQLISTVLNQVVDEIDWLLREAYQSWLPTVLKFAYSSNQCPFPLSDTVQLPTFGSLRTIRQLWVSLVILMCRLNMRITHHVVSYICKAHIFSHVCYFLGDQNLLLYSSFLYLLFVADTFLDLILCYNFD